MSRQAMAPLDVGQQVFARDWYIESLGRSLALGLAPEVLGEMKLKSSIFSIVMRPSIIATFVRPCMM